MQAIEFLGQIAGGDLPPDTLADRKHYLDGVRIVTQLVESTGGIQNVPQLLQRLDADALATIQQGTELYERVVENPLILISEL
jgi:hypothetical protein